MIFGRKSEKLVLKLEQMELQLEEDETCTQAEAEAIVERVAPDQGSEASLRDASRCLNISSAQKVTHKPDGDCCPDCGGGLRHFGMTSLNSSSMFGELQGHPAMCGRSSPVRATIEWLKRQRHGASDRARSGSTESSGTCDRLEVR